MEISLGETLYIAVVGLVIVFAILLFIMFGMMVTARILGEEVVDEQPVAKKATAIDFTGKELFDNNKNAQVAVLVAMIKASKKNQDKKFVIKRLEKI